MQQVEQLDYTPILAEMNDSLNAQNEYLHTLSQLPITQELIFNRIELLIFINILLTIATIYAIARRKHNG